jgi:G3E family GTPase
MVDQLEFADVIIINKTDLVDPVTLSKVKSLVKSLNSAADILTSVKSKIDLTRILNTKRFSFEKSIMSAGWLQVRDGCICSLPKLTFRLDFSFACPCFLPPVSA